MNKFKVGDIVKPNKSFQSQGYHGEGPITMCLGNSYLVDGLFHDTGDTVVVVRGWHDDSLELVKTTEEPPMADSTTKQTNPKDAVGVRKLAFSVLPWRVLARVALAMMEGAAKYGRHNYRPIGVRASVYFDAVVGRHLTSWWDGGEDIDPDSGLHHVDKAIAGLMVLRDSMLQGNFVDDRPPARPMDMTELNRLAGEILDKHTDKNPKHYTIKDNV